MNKQIIFRTHAIRRMFERGIGTEDVRKVLATGERIEEYPEDKPFPSRLILGFADSRPLHVVAAEDARSRTVVVITVYEPSPLRWDEKYRKRRKQ